MAAAMATRTSPTTVMPHRPAPTPASSAPPREHSRTCGKKATREPCEGEKVRLLLIRHAQIPSNVLGVLDTGAPGPSLTDLGREQARALAATLGDEPVEAAWASTLVRTQETIGPAAEQ